MKQPPPRWADRFLAWFCRPELLEDLQGDLYELYYEQLEAGRSRSARWLFVWWVFRSLRYDVIKRFPQPLITWIMTKHHFKIAARVLWRDKFNSLVNIAGLAIGLSCFLLMGFYVKQELMYDQMHHQKDRIYRVWVKEDYGGGKVFFNSVTPLIFEKVLEEDFPEVERVIQIDNSSFLVGPGPDRYNENVGIISPDFFEVFDFAIIQGNTTTPLPDRNSVILSADYARKYFGQADPIGQTLPMQIGEEQRVFTVSAVFANLPKSSSIQFNMAISTDNGDVIYGERMYTAWFNVVTESYVLIKESSTIAAVENKTQKVVMRYLENEVEPGQYQIGFQPLTDIHLNPDVPPGLAPVGNPAYVYVLGIIGLLVLITAGINYATLAIGLSLKRRREVGIRKVVGAEKSTLIRQYLSESWLVSFIAMMIAILVSYSVLPVFNELTGADVNLSFEPWHIALYLGLVIIVGLSAGIYPALILSGAKIVHILTGRKAPRQAHYIRKGMVVFQFILMVFLISSTLIMRQQLHYMTSKDLGFRYDAAVSVPLYPEPSARGLVEMINSTMERGKLFKEQLQQHPEVGRIGMGSHVFGSSAWAQMAFTDKDQNFRQFRFLVVDPYYLETFDIPILAGRGFDPESTLDQREGILLNQAAADYFGFQEPIGKRLPGNDFGDHQIIGVTDNFNYSSLHSTVEPLVIAQSIMPIAQGVSDHGFQDSPIPKLVFRFTGSTLSQVKELLEESWASVFPDEELRFSFVEDNIMAQYQNEQRMNRLVSFATLLAILIAGLGLLGMTVLVINSRRQEIGIRKVIGASEVSIFKLLAMSFAPQLLIGIVLSIPITYLLMKDWLSNFAYRIPIGIQWFVLSAVLSVAIALLVISVHTLRAARMNPVDSIK